MNSIYVTVKAQVFFDPDDVQARIDQVKADDEVILSEDAAIYSFVCDAFNPVDKATIRDVLPDFSTRK